MLCTVYNKSSSFVHSYFVEPEMIIIFLLQLSLLITWLLYHSPYLMEPCVIKNLENIGRVPTPNYRTSCSLHHDNIDGMQFMTTDTRIP